MDKLTPEQINYLYPITGCWFSPKGIKVRRQSRYFGDAKKPKPDQKRGVVKCLSRRSLHRLAFVVETSPVKFYSMLTLSYGAVYPQTGSETRKHRNTFLTWLRRKFNPLSYVWFLEFQSRGAPHLHILLSIPLPGETQEIEAGRRWCTIVRKDFPNTYSAMLKVHCFRGEEKDRMWSNIRKVDGANRYMRKYAGKQGQKRVPEGYSDIGRFWGCSRDVPLPAENMLECEMPERDLRRLLIACGREDVSRWEVIPKYVHIST